MQIEEAIKLLEEFKKNGYSMLYIKYGDRNKANLKIEKAIEALTNYIETMQSEFDRLEGIEDNTAMLKMELEKKESEIDKLRNTNKDLLKKLRNRVKEVKKLTRYSLYKKEFSRLNKQLEKKDAVIDLMAEYIYNTSNREIYDKEQEIDCIKQYFYKKAEEK